MNWTAIWSQAAAPSFAMGMLQGKKKTVVFKVISHISGETVRMRFSNIYGKKPYKIGALAVWLNGKKYNSFRQNRNFNIWEIKNFKSNKL